MTRQRKGMIPTLLFTLLIFGAVISGASAERLRGVASSGGIKSTSTRITLNGTVGGIASHRGASGIEVQSGYWNKKMALGGCDCTPGDANNDGGTNLLDILYLIDFKYKNGPPPLPYAICSGDIDCNCIINLLDIIQLIDYKYKDGPAPCDCSQWNGSCPVK